MMDLKKFNSLEKMMAVYEPLRQKYSQEEAYKAHFEAIEKEFDLIDKYKLSDEKAQEYCIAAFIQLRQQIEKSTYLITRPFNPVYNAIPTILGNTVDAKDIPQLLQNYNGYKLRFQHNMPPQEPYVVGKQAKAALEASRKERDTARIIKTLTQNDAKKFQENLINIKAGLKKAENVVKQAKPKLYDNQSDIQFLNDKEKETLRGMQSQSVLSAYKASVEASQRRIEALKKAKEVQPAPQLTQRMK